MQQNKLNVLVVGCGNMGSSHAKAYQKLDAFKLVGLVSRSTESREKLSQKLGGVPTFGDFESALQKAEPDVVSINTYPETHAVFAKMALQAGAHVFVEKPLASTVHEAEEVLALAQSKRLKVVVGYILRVHPAWSKFTELAQTLGKPLVMRMNLNQQSSGKQWQTHQNIMKSMSPIVDCGVHYLDIMCAMTSARPVSVHAIGARLSESIASDMYNYGQLQVRFEDESVGWYEAGWGPMMSETAFFVKDVIGPRGSVSICEDAPTKSQNISGHTKTNRLRLHSSKLKSNGEFAKKDEYILTEDEPDHDALCLLEQQFLLKAITEDANIEAHQSAAVNSLKIALAADKSFRTGESVSL